jgi:hypothetical protein
MQEFALSVYLENSEPEKVASFCCTHLDFEESDRGTGWIEIENGALAVRVIPLPAESGPAGPLVLEYRSGDLDATCERLARLPEVRRIAPPERVAHDRIERRVETDLGLTLVVTRKLTEDELEEAPELPTELLWQDEAIHLLQDMLRLVPLAFRDDARRRLTALAESLAAEEGEIEVTQPKALEALLRGTPDFQQRALEQALATRGLLPEADVP